jgi:hypothetical protein
VSLQITGEEDSDLDFIVEDGEVDGGSHPGMLARPLLSTLA